jgi:hypothetical protein
MHISVQNLIAVAAILGIIAYAAYLFGNYLAIQAYIRQTSTRIIIRRIGRLRRTLPPKSNQATSTACSTLSFNASFGERVDLSTLSSPNPRAARRRNQ